MNKTLYLLRHAKAEPWGPGIDDFSRPLAPAGRHHMKALAEWCERELDAPQLILCSPAARTLETVAPLLALWPEAGARCQYPRFLYGASAGSLLNCLEEALQDAGSVLMVGHNPGFEDLAFRLIPDRDAADIWKMPTGTLGVFDFSGWPEPDMDQVRLRHWITRKDLSVD